MADRSNAGGRIIRVVGAALLLAGCAYDPYTGTYAPCCAYPRYAYPPYPYPAPGYPPPPAYPTQPAPPPSPDPAAPAAADHLAQRFQSANVTGDGMLTYQQAQQAGWHVVARNFAAIDVARRGYVTLEDVRAWTAARRQTNSAAPQ